MFHHAKDSSPVLSSATSDGSDKRLGRTVCRVLVPSSLPNRTIWFTLQPIYLTNATDLWACAGELRFSLGGTGVGTFSFEWANEPGYVTATYPDVPRRPVAGGSGPVLRLGVASAAGAQTYIDVPPFSFKIEADTIELFADYIKPGGVPGIGFLAFLEVLSQAQ